MNCFGINNKLFQVVSLFALAILIYVGFFSVERLLFEKKQKAIHITTEKVIEVFQDNGYKIYALQYLDSKSDRGMFQFAKHGARLELSVYNKKYELLIVEADSWEMANAYVKVSNDLNDRMKGKLGYSICFGDILIQIFPSDKEFANELYQVLNSLESIN